jgi:hypothetical protein
MHLTETEFWKELMDDVLGTRSGGAVIIIDAENARKGVGKTSLAVALALAFARAFDYDIGKEDLVISGDDYIRQLQDHPGEYQPSTVVWDEAVGGGSGDSRRHMAEQNRVMGQAWQLLRTKRIISLVTLPDWSDLDSRLQKLADYRLWCREKPIGKFQAYKVVTPFAERGVRTKGLGGGEDTSATKIAFPDLKSAGDPLYEHISEQKEALIDADGTFDADEALAESDDQEEVDPEAAAEQAQREEAVKTALRAVKPWDDDRGMSYKDAAKLIDYSSSWVGNRVDDWDAGQYRDLIEIEAGGSAA